MEFLNDFLEQEAPNMKVFLRTISVSAYYALVPTTYFINLHRWTDLQKLVVRKFQRKEAEIQT